MALYGPIRAPPGPWGLPGPWPRPPPRPRVATPTRALERRYWSVRATPPGESAAAGGWVRGRGSQRPPRPPRRCPASCQSWAALPVIGCGAPPRACVTHRAAGLWLAGPGGLCPVIGRRGSVLCFYWLLPWQGSSPLGHLICCWCRPPRCGASRWPRAPSLTSNPASFMAFPPAIGRPLPSLPLASRRCPSALFPVADWLLHTGRGEWLSPRFSHWSRREEEACPPPRCAPPIGGAAP